MNPWCSVNRPPSASVRSGILRRRLRLARSAIVSGSRHPSINVSSIARPDTAVMSVATTASLVPVLSRTFSIFCVNRPRSRAKVVWARVKSRSSLIGSGWMNEPRTSPCAARSASHTASLTSVLGPGRLRASRGLTSITGNASSSA
jgi:hypothetical protein